MPYPVTHPGSLINKLATGIIIIGVGFFLAGEQSWEKYSQLVDGPNHYVYLDANRIGLSLQIGGAKPHPPGGPIGRPGGTYGVDIAGAALLSHVLEWRNANVHWTFFEAQIPWWLIIGIPLARPMYRYFCWIDAMRLSRRAEWLLRRATHCPVCGYDLRATPDRCPECGTIRSRS